MTPHDWLFEPCDPEGQRDAQHRPYEHAVRGVRPAAAPVTGYGHTEPQAYEDARNKARVADAHEVLKQHTAQQWWNGKEWHA